jgi:hypothetical protein
VRVLVVLVQGALALVPPVSGAPALHALALRALVLDALATTVADTLAVAWGWALELLPSVPPLTVLTVPTILTEVTEPISADMLPIRLASRTLERGSRVRGHPCKRNHLVAPRTTKISASDLPPHWWPGER